MSNEKLVQETDLGQSTEVSTESSSMQKTQSSKSSNKKGNKPKGVKFNSKTSSSSSTKPSNNGSFVNSHQANRINQLYGNVAPNVYEEVKLVTAESVGDASISNTANGNLRYQLDTIAANAQADIMQNREGFDNIIRYSKFSKRVNSRVGNKVSDGQYGLANTSVHVLDVAEERARGNNLRDNRVVNDLTIPDTVNFSLSLNISGHIPLRQMAKYQSVRETDEGFVYDRAVLNNRRLQSIELDSHNIPALGNTALFSQAETNEVRDEHVAQNQAMAAERGGTEYDWRFQEFDLAINDCRLGTDYDAAFDNDIDSFNYWSSFKILFNNINEYSVKAGKNNIPTPLKEVEFIYSKIMSDIDFATFMYIVMDSWQCNFAWANVLGNKLGIVDNTIRMFLQQRSTQILDGKDRIMSLMKIFDNIPVNTKVIESWNKIKNASNLGSDNLEDETNILAIPHFKILGAFFRSVTTNFRAAASAATSMVNIPYNNLMVDFLNTLRRHHMPARVNSINGNRFYGRNGQITTFSDNANIHEEAIISAVRMSSFSCNILYSTCFTGRVMAWVEHYFSTYKEYYKLINSTGAFEGTIFSFVKPPVINFKDTITAQFTAPAEHAVYLNSFNVNVNGEDTIPVLDSNHVHAAPDILNNLEHFIIYDKYSEKTYIQKVLKAVVVRDLGNANDGENNGGVNNNVHADFESWNLVGCIVIPFNDNRTFHFNMNITPTSSCNEIVFTAGFNRTLYETAMLFEFCAWGLPQASQTNYSQERPHISSKQLGNNYYLAADNLRAFISKASDKAIQSFVSNLKLATPKAQFLVVAKDYTININGIHGFEYPEYTTYTPKWTIQPFGSSFFGVFTMGGNKLMSPEDLSIQRKSE